MESASVAPRPRFKGCSSIYDYEVISKLGEGTFGEVHKASSKKTGAIVALKRILMHNEKDGFPVTAVREIKLLKMLSHVNVLKLEEMAVERPKIGMGKEKKKAIMYMVTPYMDHDLSGLLENPAVHLTEAHIKCYMLQLLEGLRYLHDCHILHRDMKAANLLINNKGILQIADFGLARHYDESTPKAGAGGGEAKREYTTLVVTRWYRPPELLLQLRKYTTAIDMWGVGCVFGEMFKRSPILAGKSDLNQIQMIFDLVGAPDEENMPGWSALPGCENVKQFAPRTGNLAQVFRELNSPALSLLTDLLKLDWRKRVTAIDALEHPYFRAAPLPAKPHELPTYEDSHELDRRKFRGQKAALPPAPAGGTVGMGHVNGEWVGGQGHPGYGTNGGGPGGSFASGPPSRDSRGPPSHVQHPSGPRHRPMADRGPAYAGGGAGGGGGSGGLSYDSRSGGNGPPMTGPDRRPAWERTEPRHSLPPRPPPPANGDRRGGVPPAAIPPAHPNVDTYIPAYQREGGASGGSGGTGAASSQPSRRDDRERGPHRPPVRDERERERERDYKDRDRDRDRGTRDLYRDRDDRYDRDRRRSPPPGRDRERDRDRAPRDGGRRRSPEYIDGRDYRDRDRFADRDRNDRTDKIDRVGDRDRDKNNGSAYSRNTDDRDRGSTRRRSRSRSPARRDRDNDREPYRR